MTFQPALHSFFAVLSPEPGLSVLAWLLTGCIVAFACRLERRR